MLFLAIFLRLSCMYIAGGDGMDEIRLTLRTECEHDTHGLSVARTAPNREEAGFRAAAWGNTGEAYPHTHECLVRLSCAPCLACFLTVHAPEALPCRDERAGYLYF